MDFAAAPQPERSGRRVSFGAAVVLAGFLLLAPPLFVLAPFILLSLASRPRTVREGFWLVAAAVGTGFALQGASGSLALELIRNSALLLAGCFLLLSLPAPGPSFARGLGAVLLTALAIGGWEWSRGVGWPELQRALTSLLQDSYRALLTPAGSTAPPNPDVKALLQPLLDAAPDIARVFPGLLALEGLAGLALAWGWNHRLALRPLGRPPAPFRQFRFNDHLVWAAIFTLAVLLAPLPAPWKALAANLLVLGVGLYAARGLAIVATLLAPAPGPVKLLGGLLALVLFPLALGLSLALGLADTWLDIRGRLASLASGGS